MENFRQVNIHFTTDDVRDMIQSTGSTANVYSAIGYLSTWGLSYNEVNIYREPNCNDMVAVYSVKGTNQLRYTIGAVWDRYKLAYGFHS